MCTDGRNETMARWICSHHPDGPLAAAAAAARKWREIAKSVPFGLSCRHRFINSIRLAIPPISPYRCHSSHFLASGELRAAMVARCPVQSNGAPKRVFFFRPQTVFGAVRAILNPNIESGSNAILVIEKKEDPSPNMIIIVMTQKKRPFRASNNNNNNWWQQLEPRPQHTIAQFCVLWNIWGR